MMFVKPSRGVTRHVILFPRTLSPYSIQQIFFYFFMSRVTPCDTGRRPRVSRCITMMLRGIVSRNSQRT